MNPVSLYIRRSTCEKVPRPTARYMAAVESELRQIHVEFVRTEDFERECEERARRLLERLEEME